MQFNVCIIGCGDMGKQHAKVWGARDDAKIVAVCDLLEDRRNDLANNTGATAYIDYKDAILHDGVNVVSICVPVCFHSEMACFAADNGRHIISEKPLALTLEQADAAIEAAKHNNVKLATSYQYRGGSRFRKYKELFEEGAFGGPIFLRFADVREVRPKTAMHRKSMNGGPIVDMVGHYFDLIRFITSEEPVAVYAQGHVFGKGKQRLAEVDDFAIDAATIEVTMSGGHILSVFVNWGMPEGYSGYGDEFISGPALSLKPAPDNKVEVVRGNQKELMDLAPNPPGPTVRINDLTSAIRDGSALEVSGVEGKAALRVCLAALESIETGKIVRL